VRALLFTSSGEDYLQDSIIHGFKKLYGKDAIDYPAKHILYDDYKDLKNIRGNGFTLYGLLDSNLKPEDELNIEDAISKNKFDLIVFTSIYRQYELFYKYFELLKRIKAKVWVIDGEDTPVIFPYHKKDLKKFLFSPKPHRHFIYFKRELFSKTLNSIYLRIPVSLLKKFKLPKNIRPISFSIPQQKIIDRPRIKTKSFAQHIVDEEVATQINGSANTLLFNSENDYYKDMQSSKFGITMKRAGWDCLRHYEIAANGAVICFKDLDKKPDSCAPHGLIDCKNCISYSDYSDLKNKIEKLTDNTYEDLQNEGLKWANDNSTIARVKALIHNYYSSYE
jgi:hypothetical protein